MEVDALVAYLRAWEPDAPWVENPRGTAQGGGPPWLRSEGSTNGGNAAGGANGGNSGNGGGNGGPWWAGENGSPPGQSGAGGGTGGAGTTTEAVPPQLPTAATFYAGSVAASAGNSLTLTLDDGRQVDAMLGPPWFWSESGILLEMGDRVELEGFFSSDHLEVNWINNLTRGTSKVLRVDGQPAWRAGG